MRNSVLVIDDVKEQAEGLSKALTGAISNCTFEPVFEEETIINAIENRFYNLAIVDLRMDGFSFDGIHVIKKIFEVNPFAKVLIVSAFKGEYFTKLKDLLLSGKVLDVLDKESYDIWIPKLKSVIELYFQKLDQDSSEINNALLQFYSETKNEKDTYLKGEKFEHFLSLVFQSIGFKQVLKRVIDGSKNEVDLIIRNDVADTFLGKFGKYILIECKNKPNEGVSKNDFIVFKSKIENSNGFAELGILATSGYIAKTTYIEAVRGSKDRNKIIFLSNIEIERLIRAENKLSEFKAIIDSQVKDN
ncbi:response regulator [Phnomibacter ginsenosidimutans]|uniref:Response regulator n=1 Tax=Phnomibacter ginsenosidimutans TaxID=2676868 RepID=A0A6I6G7B0_9BACT|nr:response regulator [Phnomibacter ginsenosidimutans]QGW28576.1 response regulator [Phnomibacter ginsenosidimutans]